MSTRIAYLEAVVGADITSFRHEMRQVRRDLGAVGESMAGLRRTGKALTFAVTAPLVALGAGAVQSATQFDAAMRNINAIAGLTDSQLANLSERTLEWGSTIRSGPTSAAEALYTVFSAGVSDTETAFKIAEVGARTAEAGLADLENTTEALTGAMLAYGASADEAAHFSDVITQTVAVGVGEMNQFASAFGTVIPTAQIMGISFDEVGGALAFLTQRGMDASKASTALTGAIGKLLKPTEAMEGAFRQLGVSTGSELIEKFGGLEGAMVAIGEVAGDNEQALFDMFNEKRAFKAAANFINNLDQFQNSMEEFRGNVEGATMRAWESQMESFAAKVDLLKSALQGAAVAIGSELIPIVTPLIQKFTQFFTGIRELSPEIIQMAIAFSAVAAAVGPVLLILGNIINPIGIIAGLFTAAAIAVKEDFAGIGTAVQNAWDVLEGPLTDIKDGISDLFNILFGEEAGPESVGIEDLVAERLPGEISHTIDIVLEPGTSPAREWESGEFSDVLQDAFPTFGEFLEYLEKTDQRFFREGDTISVRVGTGLDPVSTGARLSSGIQTSSVATSFSDRVDEALDEAWPRIQTAVGDLFSDAADWAINEGVPTLSKGFGRAFGEVGVAVGKGIGSLWSMIFGGGKDGPGKEGAGAGDVTTQIKDKISDPFMEGMREAFAGEDFSGQGAELVGHIASGLTAAVAGGALVRALLGKGFFSIIGTGVAGSVGTSIATKLALLNPVLFSVALAGVLALAITDQQFRDSVAQMALDVVNMFFGTDLDVGTLQKQANDFAMKYIADPITDAIDATQTVLSSPIDTPYSEAVDMEMLSQGIRRQFQMTGDMAIEMDVQLPPDAAQAVQEQWPQILQEAFPNGLPFGGESGTGVMLTLEDGTAMWLPLVTSAQTAATETEQTWHRSFSGIGDDVQEVERDTTTAMGQIAVSVNEQMGLVRQHVYHARQAFNDLLIKMQEIDGQIVRVAVQVDNPQGPMLSAGVETAPGRAVGGPVFPGNVYESHFGRGEMFVPNVGGSVLPAGRQDQSGETVIEQNTYYINFNEVSDLDRMIFEARRRGLKFANA